MTDSFFGSGFSGFALLLQLYKTRQRLVKGGPVNFQNARCRLVLHTWWVPNSVELQASSGEELALTVSVVARRLGVAPATLRTWDRRYGLGPSLRQEGCHRRYVATDVAKLEYMRSLVMAGVPAAEAAQKALTYTEDDSYSVSISRSVVTLSTREEAAQVSTRVPGGGGNVVPTHGAHASARGLARAATALDSHGCQELIARGIESDGVIVTWNQLIVPVLRGVGERWQSSGKGIEIEHVLSAAVQSALSAVVARTTMFVNSRPILLVGANNERHQLPLWAVAATSAERNIRTLMLGQGMPVDALAEAITKTGPAGVFIWSQIGPTELAELDALPVTRPAVKLIAGGPGWVGEPSRRVTPIHNLEGAVKAIEQAVCVF